MSYILHNDDMEGVFHIKQHRKNISHCSITYHYWEASLLYPGFLIYNEIRFSCFSITRKEFVMSVARVTEIKASSKKSFDDAVQVGVARAVKTLKNVKSAWIQNQDVSVDEKGNISEYRVQLKVTFILED